jgi:hypothetical protein
MPDGQLWLLRDTYAAATAWAPPYPGKELRLARLGAFDAALGARRADAEASAARKADDHDRARRHETLAASYRALHDHYQRREQILAQVMTDRQEWEHVTAGSRSLAIAADAELRRRHPGQQIDPLRSAEPAVSQADRRHPDLIPHQRSGETTRIRGLEVQRQAFCTDETYSAFCPRWQDAILQPPKPQIIPSEVILQFAAEHDIEPEAGG